MEFPDANDILNFNLIITPDEGMYNGGRFIFTFAINDNFPHEPPKVKCTQKIYHPNIDLEGNVCLNILREDWKPVLNLNAVVVGLQVRSHAVAGLLEKWQYLTASQFLFLEPNPSDPLNKDAAEDLRLDKEGFKKRVRIAMKGGSVGKEQFDRVC